MATTISEYFGFPLEDRSASALSTAEREQCPFIGDRCTKVLRGGVTAGVCTLKATRSEPVICCPNRLYADGHAFLLDVAEAAFKEILPLYPGASAAHAARDLGRPVLAAWGRRWGGELHLPQRAGSGSYFVDWVLAKLNHRGELEEFIAVEVQSIDTTGSYREGIAAAQDGRRVVQNTAGFNWENVNKRIIPQLLYKGHVLQRENLCMRGLFFVTPIPVYDKIMQRLGGEGALLPYPMKSSTITFMAYDHDWAGREHGRPAPLKLKKVFSTDTGQVAQAFAGQGVMPPANSYEFAIRMALGDE